MPESRLGNLRNGFENADALRRMTAQVKKDIPQGREIYSVQGRGEVLNALYAERRVDSMAKTISDATGGWVSDQELKDAQFLLNRARHGY